MWYEQLLAKDLIPDFLIRIGIRRLLRERINSEQRGSAEQTQEYVQDFITTLKKQPIALFTDTANEQHYEVPTAFFQTVLGQHLKYSCGYWQEMVPLRDAEQHIDRSERDMLALTCERAELRDGQRILELGCGWGSLSLFMAEHYPNSTITVVSNSTTQTAYIAEEAARRGFSNLTTIVSDMNYFTSEDSFDRIVSIEMFEHMRNYQKLLNKLAQFLVDDGKLFIHIFTHKETPYLFEVEEGTDDWMARYFFTGGMMPSTNLLLYFADDFAVEQHWKVNGKHYQRTSEAWLQKMDRHKAVLMPLMQETYGAHQAVKWWVYWRVFFMACAELFGARDGEEWFVSHYLLRKR